MNRASLSFESNEVSVNSNIKYMPAVKFLTRLDLGKNPSFRDGN